MNKSYRAAKIREEFPLVPFKGLPANLNHRAKELLSSHKENVREVSLEWGDLEGEGLFEIDREHKIIRLNRRYRKDLLRDQSPGAADLPFLKLMIFFLLEDELDKERVTIARRRRLDRINALLSEAAILGKG